MGHKYEECVIEGKKIFFKNTFSFWNYYFTGNTLEKYEIFFKDQSGTHTFLTYKKEFEEDGIIQYISDDFEVLSIYYTPSNASHLFITNNPFSKKIVLQKDVKKVFDGKHQNVCTF